MDEPLDLDGFLPYRLAVLAARTSRMLAAAYQARFDISIHEWRIIAHLAQASPVTVRDLAARTDLDRPAVSRAVDRLRLRGLVEKAPVSTDRRLVAIALTGEGQALYGRIVPLARAFEARLGDADAQAALMAGLDALDTELDAMEAAARAAGDRNADQSDGDGSSANQPQSGQP
ncbi:MarR family winged helix-turn-helix transcriptional regulator [Oceanomicrobium pacificus]|nr:MarR family winged helix-turn-helix transcriptional regulator [Oceanomicrobium pacificus]